MPTIEEILQITGIIPVIKINDADSALPMAEALAKGGLHAAEITFRTPAAAESIRKIAENFPNMFVCAGTILTVTQAELAVKSGAKAIISPGSNPEVIRWCTQNNILVYPGCATPSDVESAIRLGLTTVKLFPAEVVGGVAMLKALSGPYADVKFMPTGGISPQNVRNYLALPNVIACGGSWICSDKLLEEKDFATIEKNAREAAAIVKEFLN
ncbi:bifunctional 4-hydroxy-2-oxoglutarate aldolase/2-dehydro-3-deoxy-phosphogluconate aldolase [Scatolibacter rhodanostii]|uniref:bifunctional 4-hydroxy-2-oxoglutarate aldolase/2-dehydro-3-deoxy-phosphogluconate aldolase n=1 Tax=Scatolibacter rhodanostii TaxID=2014781 RepID=UPI000C06D4DA|nr:bifunctional 4-hydroxy-2-oxoglutarate aldolase/2-dehydro-3-deoxy-phosphogluconate aldolase [Scatolibacter rhodanostii]